MVDFEQVRRLHDYAKTISYEEAKKALEEAEGDLLEAIIKLEKENKIKRPETAGYYNSQTEAQSEAGNVHVRRNQRPQDKGRSFRDLINAFLRWCGRMIHKGNRNSFEVWQDESRIITLPITVLVLFAFFAFWIVLPLLILGLFLGYRYRFSGPDLDKPEVNQTVEKVTQATVRAVDSVVKAVENMAKDEDQNKGERDGADSDH